MATSLDMGLKKKWNHVNRFNNATFLRLSQARSCISNVICVGLFVFDDFRIELIVNVVDIGDFYLPLNSKHD